jgi:Trk K+ transport system NAD-binding subunit
MTAFISPVVLSIALGGYGGEPSLSSAEIKGRDFEAALDYFRREHRAIVVAVLRGDKALVNPEVGLRLEAGDELAVIALDEPTL